jgi:signal transduction histidine kinase
LAQRELTEGDQARQRLQTIQAANAALAGSLDLDTVLERLLDHLRELVPYDSANVMLWTGANQVAIRALRGYDRWSGAAAARSITFDMQDTPTICAVFDRQQSVLVPDTAECPGWVRLEGAEHVRSWFAVPLAVSGKILGLFSVDKAEPGFFTDEHVRLAEALAPQAAVAIQNAQLYADVSTGREQLQSLSRRLVELQEQERRALSRDLHDTSAQNITALTLGLGALVRAGDCSADTRARVDELLRLTETVSEDLHRLAVNLRPLALDRSGLIPALEQLLVAFRKQTGLTIDFDALGTGSPAARLPGDVETVLYRIVQESLTNIARYALAKRVSVLFSLRDNRAQVIIEDDGRGFDVEEALRGGRLGLLGMRERAGMLGGQLTIESEPGHGTTIAVEVPVVPPSRPE